MNAPLTAIRNDDDHARAMEEVGRLWGSPLGTPDGDRLDALATLIQDYELQHHVVPLADPIDAIAAELEEQAVAGEELASLFGTAEIAREVLARQRELTLDTIRRLHARLGISADILIRPIRLASAA